jgi:hypothetical protein
MIGSVHSLHLTWWLAPTLIALILWALSSVASRGKLRGAYNDHLAETPRERLFLASVGFFVTVVVVRSLTVAIHYGFGGFHDVELHGRHIHHMVWGIGLLLVTGYGWVAKLGIGSSGSMTWAGRVMSMAYGVGAALTLDEFALWLNLRDVYWEREGRASLEAMFLFGGLLCISIYGGRFFRAVWNRR